MAGLDEIQRRWFIRKLGHAMDLKKLLNDTGSRFTELMASLNLPSTASQSERDFFALELAKAIRMESGGRAEEYLNHFLSGTGTEKKFEMRRLLNEDEGVRQRVYNEVSRRILGIKTLREKGEDSRMSLSSKACQDRLIITIFQKNFRVSDWHLALGTFPVTWEILGENDSEISARIWGRNTYQWHPDSKRITQFLHQAGHRLHQSGVAKNFDIVGEPTTLIISKRFKQVLRMTTWTQTNPSHRKLN